MDDIALQLEILRRQPRTLDGPPPKLQFTKLKDPTICGYSDTFKSLFYSLVGTVNVELYTIDIMGNKTIGCDETVFYILKSLLVSNVCYSIDYSQACTDIFTAIVLYGKDYISTGAMYEVLSSYKAKTYEHQILLSTINELCYSDTAAVFEWNKIANCTRLYPNIRNVVLNYIFDNDIRKAGDLLKELRESYKASREDKKFTDQLVSGIPNKLFIGALYKFHKLYPEVMTVVEEDVGFMKGGA